ncbi:unnamed protein product [Blepharisma stoltei]|uniref:Uncharacterized protein n=1 Tax=Blepharisma stoltei TaxID=1481888 RepID=A0AAU9JNN3_9CILI|nr:unnamed protein product [Blepharisma stoltei]
MGICACSERNAYLDHTTAKDYRAKMVVEYLDGLKKFKNKKADESDEESEYENTSGGENSFDNSLFNIPEGLNEGDVFVIGDRSQFKVVKVTDYYENSITHCIACNVNIPAHQIKTHAKLADHMKKIV